METHPSAWADSSLAPCRGVERLREDQPPSGLLWLISGEVRLSVRGRERVLRKGDIVAYRLGDALRWSSGEDTRVRWSARPVRLSLGSAEAWTSDLATRLPAVTPRSRRRLRSLVALAIVLLSSVVVSALYAARHATEQRRMEEEAKAGPPTDEEQRILEAIGREARRQGFALRDARPAFQGLYLVDLYAVLGSDEEAAEALAPLADAILGLSPRVARVRLRLMTHDPESGEEVPRTELMVPERR